ncbi:MAG: hypothetical protein ACLFU9_06010 [Candidatus Bathyarchaeia archaeon]
MDKALTITFAFFSLMASRPDTLEKRRKEALEALVRKYYESKEHEEKFRRKLESYSLIRKWVYLRSVSLKQTLGFLKDVVVKPFFIGMLSISGFISALLATSIMPKAGPLIERSIPFPLNYLTVALLATSIAFSPFIISLEVYRYHEVKREKKILQEEYHLL